MTTTLGAPALLGPAGSRRRLVVIGNGMAGARAVEEVLRRGGGDAFAVTMFGEEPYGNYNRIMLSGVLAGQEDPADIFINPLDWYAENGIDLRAGVRVARIDRAAKEVVDEDGFATPYDTLVVATGSRAFLPPIAGLLPDGELRDGAFVFRSLDDCEAITHHAAGCRAACVIGGGLLGLEAARGLMCQGLDVSVVEAAPHLMVQQLDAEPAEILASTLRGMGIGVHCGAATTEVLGEDRITGVRFADGAELRCDMVVVAAGIRPNVALAAECGLTVERGVVVDDRMRTDDPDVYAVGEVAQHRGQVYGLVAPLWEQARVLADHLTGSDPEAAYRGSKLATKLKVMGVDLAVMGLKAAERDDDEVLRFSDPRRGQYMSVVVRDGVLVGATLLGDTSRAGLLTQAFDRASPLPEDRRQLLFDIGGAPPAATVDDLPDESQVCNCNGVSKGAIARCVAGGARTVGAVMAATRAGTGCGSCKALVGQVVEWAAGGEVEEDPSAHYYVPGVPLPKAELVEAIRARNLRSVSEVFDALAGGKDDPGSKMGLTSLLRSVWGRDELVDERDARFINDRVHANIQGDGTFSVVPSIPGGVTTADELRRIADVADRYAVRMIKITGGQRIDLLGVRKDDLPAVWRDLGMPSGHAYGKSFRTVKSCVGSEFCRFGLGDSTTLAIRLEERYRGIEAPAKLKLAVAGCPRNCSEALVKDVGVVAVDGGRWEVYVGGAAGAHVRKGDLLCTVDTPEEVITLAGRFIQYYRENARWLERTYDFVPRVGLEHLRAVVVEDAHGEAARLDAEIERTVTDYVDPWTEASRPATVNQFAGAIRAAGR
ncbi:MAG: nitrite reductase large subunit NirB [Actinomycetota bacterium]